jgi:hypothetical protein
MSPVDRRRRVTYLLYELCARFGFCLPEEGRERIESDPPTDPDAFAAAVYRAEGFEPPTDPAEYAAMRVVIVRTLSAPGYRDA